MAANYLYANCIIINVGEDIKSRICSLPLQGWSEVSILSALGRVSNVTLQSSVMPGATITYEGQYEILKISGTFLPRRGGNATIREGNLQISMAGPDHNVYGGVVAGPLIASSSIQVILGLNRESAEVVSV